MSQALTTAVSGLRSDQAWMDVIGNNIANANTPGFKSSSVVFSDILSQTLTSGAPPTATKGGVNPTQVGLGTTVGSITPNFQQGSIETTNRSTDVAIQGGGFFVLANGADRLYTRAGTFVLDANGTLVDSGTGFKVQGAQGDITIGTGQQTTPTPTTQALFKGNLDASAADGTTYTATLNVIDSLGEPHTLSITFTKNFASAPGKWTWAATPSASDTAISSLTTATGSVVFGATGAIASGSSQAVGIVYAAAAGVTTPQSVTLDFGTATNTTPMTGVASPSTATLASHDGLPPGTLQSFAIGTDGAVTAFYSNSKSVVLDTVQLASFTNPTGLFKVGSNQFRENETSGAASIGNPATGDRGTLVAGALEQSNVDLAQEFSNMIVAERGFQANARMISTANTLLQEVVDLRR